jgi:hypothetical protein
MVERRFFPPRFYLKRIGPDGRQIFFTPGVRSRSPSARGRQQFFCAASRRFSPLQSVAPDRRRLGMAIDMAVMVAGFGRLGIAICYRADVPRQIAVLPLIRRLTLVSKSLFGTSSFRTGGRNDREIEGCRRFAG